MKRPLLLLLLFLLLGARPEKNTVATKEEAAASSAEKEEEKPAPPAADLFQGFLIAANATDLYAPEFVFRVAGWSSDWGSRKIVELVPDGKTVKAGDLVARFEFGAADARRHIDERVQEATSRLQQDDIAAQQSLDAMEMQRRRMLINAETATLNLQRASALSRMQADALAIHKKVADFDVVAATELLESAKVRWAAVRESRRRELAAAQEGIARYDYYFNRFTLRAPHDGVVRHGFNPRERRKLQKGDNAGAGMKILAVAKDEELAVRFFVPEARAPQVKVGTKIAVLDPTRAQEIEGEVVAVDFFPQELGFLLENESLPNAREKAIPVRAKLSSPSSGLAAGTEIRVKVREP